MSYIVLKRCLIYEIGVLYNYEIGVLYSIKEVSYIRNRCPLNTKFNTCPIYRCLK